MTGPEATAEGGAELRDEDEAESEAPGCRVRSKPMQQPATISRSGSDTFAVEAEDGRIELRAPTGPDSL